MAVTFADRVLVVGSGAREHALGRALREDAPSTELVFAPGNAGTAALGRNVTVAAGDVPALVALAKAENVRLVVIGPELPLTLGLVDALAAEGVPAFGPSRAAAQLEGSKVLMKRFAERAGLPTAPFVVFADVALAEAYLRQENRPLVVKADGLAAGKGVVVASGADEALAAVDRWMRHGDLGDAGRTVVIEELLAGEEASFHVVCDGERFVVLPAAQDHKRVFDGDRGPNTGGMGAYAPAPIVTAAVEAKVIERIVRPTLAAMRAEGNPFRGALFVGLMIDRGEPQLLEFNVRFGDPETAVLTLVQDGWLGLLEGAANGALDPGLAARRRSDSALAVVMAAEKYPATPVSGDAIAGLDDAATVPDSVVFHAGTGADAGGAIVTRGGRVLTVAGRGADLVTARERAYSAVAKVHFRGEHHRTDIGARALPKR
jgi:phosphoribosylamine--glycine ligase